MAEIKSMSQKQRPKIRKDSVSTVDSCLHGPFLYLGKSTFRDCLYLGRLAMTRFRDERRQIEILSRQTIFEVLSRETRFRISPEQCTSDAPRYSLTNDSIGHGFLL